MKNYQYAVQSSHVGERRLAYAGGRARRPPRRSTFGLRRRPLAAASFRQATSGMRRRPSAADAPAGDIDLHRGTVARTRRRTTSGQRRRPLTVAAPARAGGGGSRRPLLMAASGFRRRTLAAAAPAGTCDLRGGRSRRHLRRVTYGVPAAARGGCSGGRRPTSVGGCCCGRRPDLHGGRSRRPLRRATSGLLRRPHLRATSGLRRRSLAGASLTDEIGPAPPIAYRRCACAGERSRWTRRRPTFCLRRRPLPAAPAAADVRHAPVAVCFCGRRSA